MMSDDSSELSSIASDDEILQPPKKDGILKFFSKAPKAAPAPKEPSPPPRKRSPSPPHEFVLADNPDIAVSLWDRNRVLRVCCASESRCELS
jgi:hypothetical protein